MFTETSRTQTPVANARLGAQHMKTKSARTDGTIFFAVHAWSGSTCDIVNGAAAMRTFSTVNHGPSNAMWFHMQCPSSVSMTAVSFCALHPCAVAMASLWVLSEMFSTPPWNGWKEAFSHSTPKTLHRHFTEIFAHHCSSFVCLHGFSVKTHQIQITRWMPLHGTDLHTFGIGLRWPFHCFVSACLQCAQVDHQVFEIVGSVGHVGEGELHSANQGSARCFTAQALHQPMLLRPGTRSVRSSRSHEPV